MFINQLIGMIGFMLKPLTDSATTNLMLALSPTIIVSLITFVVSLFFILTIAYNHIKKNNILIFTGWFSVVYIAIALIIQLIYIILSALLSSFVLNLVI
ncbi:MAG: hypothetical protein GXZ08_05335 [Tissierellia bacterium]|nr:hypothetical protein [Tissierellia bacterium]